MRRTKTMLMGELLEEFFAKPHIARKVAEGRIEELWREAVGDVYARYTSELKIERQILTAKINSGVLKNELFYKRKELCAKINQIARVEFLRDIIIR